ncbi:hypothetical protein [Psychrobacter sp.]|uniref:hypothetical protein n=1 Tax=Psychrobacter sp. TaxID=56811 RepID=UPI0026490149|nr:hypothetical protein [Psychrobacter sp.]MDN6307408.1 hypothetical protein [Psychrobacter sp.]
MAKKTASKTDKANAKSNTKNSAKTNAKNSDNFEEALWDAANKLRGSVDPCRQIRTHKLGRF